VEPFCGGLAVALGLRPARALLNDLNPHVINFYNWLKRGLVIREPMANTAACFYERRRRFNDLLAEGGAGTAEAAGLFYYLNRTGYNGLCRFNRRGRFNVPFGRYVRINYRREFPEYETAFAGWEFTSTAFESLPLSADDFVYADPPYDVQFTQYSQTAFGWDQQVRTAQWLSGHPGPVILSNQATSRICKLYAALGFDLQMLEAPRRINCTGDRSPALEVLATRNLAPLGLTPDSAGIEPVGRARVPVQVTGSTPPAQTAARPGRGRRPRPLTAARRSRRANPPR
jgi:DNA adenine methylase